MEAVGYAKKDKEFKKSLDLSQVNLCCKKEELDSIIDFLTKIKKEAGAYNIEKGDHWHYRDYDDSWNEKEPDLIIYMTNDADE